MLWLNRYTSVAALETLGTTFRDATELFDHYFDAFYYETKYAGNDGHISEGDDGKGVEGILGEQLLIKKVATPLSECPAQQQYSM